MMYRWAYYLLLSLISLLFVLTSVFTIQLLGRNELLVDNFYRVSHWNISQIENEMNTFRLDLKLYRIGGISFDALSRQYDVLWTRLETFLEGEESRVARERFELSPLLNSVHQDIALIESQMDQGVLNDSRLLDELEHRLENNQKILHMKVLQVFHLPTQIAMIEQQRQTLRWLMLGQLGLLASGLVLVFALVRAYLTNYRLARRDALTGLANRRALIEQLRYQIGGCLILIDLKHFKQINDQLGYQYGDKALVETGRRLELFNMAVAYRLGGDEFAILLTPAPDEIDLQKLIYKLLAEIPFECSNGKLKFRIEGRIGVAIAGEGELCGELLLSRAIFSLNRAKSSGQDIVHFQAALYADLESARVRSELLRELESNVDWPLNLSWVQINDLFGTPCLVKPELSWQQSGDVCSWEWLDEMGLLEPVLNVVCKRWKKEVTSQSPLLLPCLGPRLWMLLEAFGVASNSVLLVKDNNLFESEQNREALVARGNQLVITELGTQTVGLLRSGWPLHYWWPDQQCCIKSELLQTLAAELGLVVLVRDSEQMFVNPIAGRRIV
ncbi:diguanylate cyclase domain-containing protein [Aeromonas sp. MdU4]|uniref:GGDEF domain-containing protein n=1 Tax=Aeromonas sp. MdU4 TaxID=3342819 RepID=UPI0035B739BE